MNYYLIGPEDKILRKEKFQGYTIIEYEGILGFRFFNVYKKEKYLSTFQIRTEAKEYIKRIIKEKHEAEEKVLRMMSNPQKEYEKGLKEFRELVNKRIEHYIKILLKEIENDNVHERPQNKTENLHED